MELIDITKQLLLWRENEKRDGERLICILLCSNCIPYAHTTVLQLGRIINIIRSWVNFIITSGLYLQQSPFCSLEV